MGHASDGEISHAPTAEKRIVSVRSLNGKEGGERAAKKACSQDIALKPVWFREGMAYSLSEDPRRPLTEPVQEYRSRFEDWFKQTGLARLLPRAIPESGRCL